MTFQRPLPTPSNAPGGELIVGRFDLPTSSNGGCSPTPPITPIWRWKLEGGLEGLHLPTRGLRAARALEGVGSVPKKVDFPLRGYRSAAEAGLRSLPATAERAWGEPGEGSAHLGGGAGARPLRVLPTVSAYDTHRFRVAGPKGTATGS